MASSNEIVPLSTSVAHMRSQYNIADERQIQPYQQSKYRSWTPDNSDLPLNPNPNDSKTATGSCKKHINTKFFVSLFIGLAICGIPLAVMTTLYIEKKAENSTSSGSSGSSSSSDSLPSQCTSYTINSDPTRLITYPYCSGYCPYDSTGSFSTGWYRFTDGAGTRLSTTPPSYSYCGAIYPIWVNTTFPTTTGSTVTTFGCVVTSSGYLCVTTYNIQISITNCNSYYVFYLQPTSSSNLRYCTTS